MTEKLDDTEQAMMAYAQRCADLEAERDAARDDANFFVVAVLAMWFVLMFAAAGSGA